MSLSQSNKERHYGANKNILRRNRPYADGGFDDPQKEAVAEAINDEMIVMKSESGEILGFEKFNVHFLHPNGVTINYAHAA